MKIAISSSAGNLDAEVDPRFGRAACFLLVDSETMDFVVLENQQNYQAAQGAGIQAATLVARHKPAAVLTGHCGPKAFEVFRWAGIPVVVGVSGRVRDAVDKFLGDGFTPASSADVAGHWG
ncbi:MAG TPA: NifB/NifX family molybdenum-iron cluster-binding protein [Syntrophobacteraceae bacterium]|nr:NifB/NifX family molybdenum-iron cluster-binding protein [Syntrophobacteraceae bacterium]